MATAWLLACAIATALASNLSTELLRVQNSVNPTVEFGSSIEFSWSPASFKRDISSTAYRVVVQERGGNGVL